jgi:ElaB/YqjD/DUF883 family membrane-anchored ribosome-binding protein
MAEEQTAQQILRLEEEIKVWEAEIELLKRRLASATTEEAQSIQRRKNHLIDKCLANLREIARLNNFYGSARCREFWDIVLNIQTSRQPRRSRR